MFDNIQSERRRLWVLGLALLPLLLVAPIAGAVVGTANFLSNWRESWRFTRWVIAQKRGQFHG